MTRVKKKSESISEKMKRLEMIAEWFDRGEDLDLEEGLKRIEEAATLLTESRKRLAEIENRFEEVRRGVDKNK